MIRSMIVLQKTSSYLTPTYSLYDKSSITAANPNNMSNLNKISEHPERD